MEARKGEVGIDWKLDAFRTDRPKAVRLESNYYDTIWDREDGKGKTDKTPWAIRRLDFQRPESSSSYLGCKRTTAQLLRENKHYRTLYIWSSCRCLFYYMRHDRCQRSRITFSRYLCWIKRERERERERPVERPELASVHRYPIFKYISIFSCSILSRSLYPSDHHRHTVQRRPSLFEYLDIFLFGLKRFTVQSCELKTTIVVVDRLCCWISGDGGGGGRLIASFLHHWILFRRPSLSGRYLSI